MARDAGPAPDATVAPDAGPSPDAGPRTDAGTTAMCPAGACDLLTNGCAAGQACYFLAPSGGDAPMPLCDTSGSGGDGAACTTYRDCRAGYFCDASVGFCRHYCCAGSDVGCPVDQICAVLFVDDMGRDLGVGYCAGASG